MKNSPAPHDQASGDLNLECLHLALGPEDHAACRERIGAIINSDDGNHVRVGQWCGQIR